MTSTPLAEVKSFVEAVFRYPDGLVEIRSLPNRRQRYFEITDVHGMWQHALQEMAREQNIFVGVATRDGQGGGKQNIVHSPAVWVDIDYKDTPQNQAERLVTDFPLPPTMVVESGGGLHLYWRLKEPLERTELTRLESIAKRLAQRLGGDIGATDAARVLRLPATKNFKYDPPRFVRLQQVSDLEYNPEDFEEILPELELPKPTASKLPEVVPGGTRDKTMASFAGSMRRVGATPEEIFAALQAINQRCDPPKDDSELERIARSVGRYPPAEDETDDAIQIRDGNQAELVDACEAVLARDGIPLDHKTFQRGGALVRVARVPAFDEAGGVYRPKGSAVVQPVSPAFVLDGLSRYARFKKHDRRTKVWRSANPPRQVADLILARRGLWNFPVLRGVFSCPTLRPDGSLLLQPGYDGATGYFLAHDLKVEVPDHPSPEQARESLLAVDKLLDGFEFQEEADRITALALLLSGVARPAFDNSPLFSITAPIKGSGKSTLGDITGGLGTGRRSVVLSATLDREELEKRLAGCLLSGDALVTLDNLNGVLRSDLLCQAITQSVLKLRPLGSSDQVEVQNTALWLANGNNLSLAGDLTRRALLIRLDPSMERPEERIFSFDPVKRVLESRAEYVGHVLTVLRGYVVAGWPDMKLTPFGSFERWSALVRSALVWCGAEDPCKSRLAVEDADPDKALLRGLLTAWYDRFQSGPTVVKELAGAALEKDSPLGELLAEISGDGHGVNTRKVAWWLRRQAGVIVDGLKVVQVTGSRVASWRVVKC